MLAWGVEGFVVSFIAPHTLTARSLVVGPDDLLEVTNRSGAEEVELTTDGRPGGARWPRARASTVSLRRDSVLLAQAAGSDLLRPPAREVRPSGLLELVTVLARSPIGPRSSLGRSVGSRW